MQDALISKWARESHLSVEHLNSMRDLNRRFLDLSEAVASEWPTGGAGRRAALGRQIAPLTALQRAAAANCPYALFDLRFADEPYWRGRLAETATCRVVADEPGVDTATLDFVRLAIFYTWHLASTTALAAQLMLGMHNATAAAFRRITVDGLPALVATEAMNLCARWSDRQTYWSALLGAAAKADDRALRRVQLSGLQLAAAVDLPVV